MSLLIPSSINAALLAVSAPLWPLALALGLDVVGAVGGAVALCFSGRAGDGPRPNPPGTLLPHSRDDVGVPSCELDLSPLCPRLVRLVLPEFLAAIRAFVSSFVVRRNSSVLRTAEDGGREARVSSHVL